MTGTRSSSRTKVLIAGTYILVCLIWGTNWIAIKYAVTDMPPLLSSGLRFLVAGPFLIGLCRVLHVPLLFPRHLLWFAAFATVGYFCVPFLLFNIAEQHISSGLTAICFAMVCVLIVLLSKPILGAQLRLGQLGGVALAVCALVLLIAGLEDLSASSLWGTAAALAAAAMHAYAYVVIKKYGESVHSLTLNTLPAILAGVLLTCASLITDRPGTEVFTAQSVLATVHLGLVASVIGLVVYFWLLQQLSAITVSFVFVIFPVIAQLVSVTAERVPFGAKEALLTLAILGGFAWTQLAGRKEKRPHVETWGPTEEQLAMIYAHAASVYPAECCGFVTRTKVHTCVNAIEETEAGSERTARTGFAFAPSDLVALNRSFDTDDPALIIYHSHPDVGAYFSEEDQRFAVMNGEPTYPVDHLVVDVTAAGVNGARWYRYDRDTASYSEIAVYGSPKSRVEGPVK